MGVAASTGPAKNSRPEPDINVTPLVDVCLVLLIIFMVIAPSLENGQRVELPAILRPDKSLKTKMDPVTLTIAQGGVVFYEKEAIEPSALKTRLAEIHAKEPDKRVVLKGDALLPYARVREIFATVQDTGFPGVALLVSKKPGPKGSQDDDEKEGS